MKKSSLKTFLRGENPYSSVSGSEAGTTVKLLNSKTIGLVCFDENSQTALNAETVQHVSGFERAWYCDVLDDGIAVTYYAY